VPLSFHDPSVLPESIHCAVLAAFVKEGCIVRIVSDKAQGPTAGTHTFGALEFLARVRTCRGRRDRRSLCKTTNATSCIRARLATRHPLVESVHGSYQHD
jgi:hypothetical protein